MSASELLAKIGRLGIRLEVVDDRLRYAPRSVLPAELAEQLRAEKAEVVRLLQGPPVETSDALPVATGPDGWPIDSFDPDDLAPCPACRTLELWQSIAGRWRCQRCDPPTVADRLEKTAARIRRKSPKPLLDTMASIGHNAPCLRNEPN